MRVRYAAIPFVLFFVVALTVPFVGAYSTAWCEACNQFIVENDGVFAFNGTAFVDLTWEIEPPSLSDLYSTEFIHNIGVATAGNVTVIYSIYHDSLYMGLYNGRLPVVMRPVLGWYVGSVRNFMSYNGSIFFVASTSCCGPHYAGDEVYRIGPRTIESWNLIRYARKIVPPKEETLSPQARIKLGLDENGRLWAGVHLWDSNVTLYYLYNGTNFTLVNASPHLHVPEPDPPFRIEVRKGITYYQSYYLQPYTPTRYVLIQNGTPRDVTYEIKKLAYSTRPLKLVHAFWDNRRKEWVVSFGMYGLPVTYAVNGSCRKPLDVKGLPIEVYNGSYVILGNGTLSWRGQIVKTPYRVSRGINFKSAELEVYVRDGRPVIAFPLSLYVNGSSSAGFVLYEVTLRGFDVRNVTGIEKPGREILLYPVTGDRDFCRGNVAGTLCVNTKTRTAFIRTENGTVPVNYSVAAGTEVVISGNGTSLLVSDDDVYIVPPYDKPVSVLSLPICVEGNGVGKDKEIAQNTGVSSNTILYGIAALGLIIMIALLKRR